MQQNEKASAPRTECLTAAELVAYAARELSREKLAELDGHLNDCRFCLDAAAGVEEVRESFLPRVESLNAKVRARSTARAGFYPGWRHYLALAATLVLALGGALFLFRTAPNEALFSATFEPYPSNAPLVRGETRRDRVREALEPYEAGDYAKALGVLESILKDEPDNPVALFYSGVSQLALDKPGDAVSSFERVCALGKTELSESARWYLALAYLKLNSIGKARSTLDEIARSESFYKDRAEALLEKLHDLSAAK